MSFRGAVSSFLLEWYWASHRTLGQKVNKCISQNVELFLYICSGHVCVVNVMKSSATSSLNCKIKGCIVCFLWLYTVLCEWQRDLYMMSGLHDSAALSNIRWITILSVARGITFRGIRLRQAAIYCLQLSKCMMHFFVTFGFFLNITGQYDKCIFCLIFQISSHQPALVSVHTCTINNYNCIWLPKWQNDQIRETRKAKDFSLNHFVSKITSLMLQV